MQCQFECQNLTSLLMQALDMDLFLSVPIHVNRTQAMRRTLKI